MNTLPANENGRDQADPWFALGGFVATVVGLALCSAWLRAEREEGATS